MSIGTACSLESVGQGRKLSLGNVGAGGDGGGAKGKWEWGLEEMEGLLEDVGAGQVMND